MKVVINETSWDVDSEERGLGGCYLEAKSVIPTLNKKKKNGQAGRLWAGINESKGL